MKKFLVCLLTIFIVLCLSFECYGKGGGRGGGFSRAFSSKMSTSSISKPSISGSASKSGSFGSFKSYSNPVKTDAPRKITTPTSDDARDFFNSPPAYVYNTSNRFGIWDTVFLMYMMSTMNATWFHNHQNDEGVKKFREELEKMSKENEEVKKQKEELEKQLEKMKEENKPVDENYVAEDVKQEDAKTVLETISSWFKGE